MHHPPRADLARRRGEALAFLVKQFVRCGPAVPFATGARGPGFYATVAARSLAGVGLIIGERAVARRRLKVVVAEHTALLAEVAKHHPLIFLEQVGQVGVPMISAGA